jgi:hypothetical protein
MDRLVVSKTAMQAMKNEDAIFVGPIMDNTGSKWRRPERRMDPMPTNFSRPTI